MDHFLYIREGPTWPRLDTDASAESYMEALQDSCLWQLPLQRGAPCVDETLVDIQTQRVIRGLHALCLSLNWELPKMNSLRDQHAWLLDKIPSLDSMHSVEHSMEVQAAYLCLLLKDPQKISAIGPKQSKEDPIFVNKVKHLYQIEDWLSFLRNEYNSQRQRRVDDILNEWSVVSLPTGAVSQEHFVKNYASTDTVDNLEAQKNAIMERFAPYQCRWSEMSCFFWVDPEPMEGKSFQVLLYK